MSQNTAKLLLGHDIGSGFKGQSVGIPVAVSFLPTSMTWGRRGNQFVQVADDADAAEEIHVKSLWLDAWEIRDQFLRLKVEDATAFLTRTGIFHSTLGSGKTTAEDLFEIQGIIRYLLTSAPPTWREVPHVFKTDRIHRILRRSYQTFSIRFSWSRNSRTAVIETRTTLDAIMATVFIDHVRAARIGFCERPDCRKQFEFESRHARKYCSYNCAHLMSVRMKRERDRTKEAGGISVPRPRRD